MQPHEQVEHGSPVSIYSSSLKSQRADPEARLDEVAAPPPVYDRSKKSNRRQQFLENEYSQDQDPEQPVAAATKEHERSNPKRLEHRFVWMVYVVSYLVAYSFVGTMLRMVIKSLTFYPGAPVNTGVLWANVGGSFIIGFLSEDKELFNFREINMEFKDHTKRSKHLVAYKKTVPLYISLTTGFCGCLTSFSTFICDIFLALSNNLPVPFGLYSDILLYSTGSAGTSAPNGGFNFMAILAVLFIEVGLSLASLKLGAHIAIFLTP